MHFQVFCGLQELGLTNRNQASPPALHTLLRTALLRFQPGVKWSLSYLGSSQQAPASTTGSQLQYQASQEVEDALQIAKRRISKRVLDQAFTLHPILSNNRVPLGKQEKSRRKIYQSVPHIEANIYIYIYIYSNNIILIYSILISIFHVFQSIYEECSHYYLLIYNTLCSTLIAKLGGRCSIPSLTYIVSLILLSPFSFIMRHP